MIKAKTERSDYNIESSEHSKLTGRLNSEEFEIEIIKSKSKSSKVKYLGKEYNINIINYNRDNKEIELLINGYQQKVVISDEYDQLISSMGYESNSSQADKIISAPMPGMVLEILIKQGDRVNKGDNLIVLEAMKMENIIKSPVDAVIKSIEVEKGKTVEKDEVLIVLE